MKSFSNGLVLVFSVCFFPQSFGQQGQDYYRTRKAIGLALEITDAEIAKEQSLRACENSRRKGTQKEQNDCLYYCAGFGEQSQAIVHSKPCEYEGYYDEDDNRQHKSETTLHINCSCQ